MQPETCGLLIRVSGPDLSDSRKRLDLDAGLVVGGAEVARGAGVDCKCKCRQHLLEKDHRSDEEQ